MANKPNLIKTGAEIAFETTLDTTIDSDDTSLILTSADGLPSSNFCLILDYDVPTKEKQLLLNQEQEQLVLYMQMVEDTTQLLQLVTQVVCVK